MIASYINDSINIFLELLDACSDNSIFLWLSVLIELFNQKFYIIINLSRNERWSQRHEINEDDADRWDADEIDHDDDDDDDDGDDECQKKDLQQVWCVGLLG